MNKDIVDIIKAQGNQACVMIPDILDIPTIDLGNVEMDFNSINIKLSEEQKLKLIDLLDKLQFNGRFLLEFKSLNDTLHSNFKILMTFNSEAIDLSDGSKNIFKFFTSSPAATESTSVHVFIIVYAYLENAIKEIDFSYKRLA